MRPTRMRHASRAVRENEHEGRGSTGIVDSFCMPFRQSLERVPCYLRDLPFAGMEGCMRDAGTVEPVVYVKNGCGWCEEVIEYFEARGMPFRKVVVSGNPEAYREMVTLSGQSRAPTMNWDGDVLADFGVDELVDFLKARGMA